MCVRVLAFASAWSPRGGDRKFEIATPEPKAGDGLDNCVVDPDLYNKYHVSLCPVWGHVAWRGTGPCSKSSHIRWIRSDSVSDISSLNSHVFGS
jgi:hypothetical protein